MKRKGILSTENTERMEVGAVSSGRSVVNTEDLPDGFQMTELGPLPKEWRVVRLGEVAAITSGGSAPQGEQYFLNGKNPFVRVQHLDIDGDYVRRWDLITDEAVEHYRLKKFPAGTIVFPKSGAAIRLEKRAILLVDAHIVSHLCAVLPKTGKVDRWFIFYSLRAKRLAEDKAEGYPVLNLSEIRDVPIPLPPLPEQRAIAHVLRTVQRAKETTEGVIAALKELKKSLMQHLFTYGPVPVTERERVPLQETEIGPIPAHWRVVRLGEVALLERGLSWSKADEGSNGIGVLSIPDILTNGRLNPFPRVHLSKQVTSNKLLVKGDILLVGSSGAAKNVGRSGVLREEPASPLAFASFTIRLRGKPDAVLQEFAFYLIQSSWIDFAHFSKQAADGKYNLQLRQLQSAFIPLPPLDEQREIARILQAVDAKIAAEERHRTALEEVFKTLLHQLMTGKVRVKGFHLPELE
jgi:type I restriction enzyme S subunit